ncbi:hypothetical protein LPJ57_006400, partial [Coemansia sp. RSA 486]
MGERMQNNGQVAAGPQQQTHSPAVHAHSAYHMSTPDAAIRPLADEHGRSNKVENLLQSQPLQTASNRTPETASMPISNGNRSSESSSSSAGLPLKDHLPLTTSPLYNSETQRQQQQQQQQQSQQTPRMSTQEAPDYRQQKQQPSTTTQHSRTNRPANQTGAQQLPSIPAMSYASAEAGASSGPQTQRIPPPTGSFGPSQYSSGQPPLRRTRPHAATISEPMMGPQTAMQQSRSSQMQSSQAPPSQQLQQQQQQQPFRFFPRQTQGPPGFESRLSQHPTHFQQQQQQGPQDTRPRRLSFANSHLLQDGHRDQYETSFSRSTNTAGAAAHYGPGGQSSPTTQFFGSHQPMHPQMHPQQPRQHPSLPPPPASAPSHQQHFGQSPNQPHRSQTHAGSAPGAYGPPRSAHGPPNSAGMPQQGSLSPPLTMRRQFPPTGRFEPGNSSQRQQLPVPFPRIPSPMRHSGSTQNTANTQQQSSATAHGSAPPASASTAAAAAAAAATSASASGSAAVGSNNAANATSQSPARESTRRLSSVVWGPTGFERLDTGMSRCKICGKEYSRGSSTGTLKRHFKQHHVNLSLTSPYTRNSPPNQTQGSRPRAYSHRVDMRTRRETSPSPFAATPSAHSQHQQSYQQPQGAGVSALAVQQQHQSQIRSQMQQRQYHPQHPLQQQQHLRQSQIQRQSSPGDEKHGSQQSMITPDTSGSSTAMATLFSRNSGSVPADIDSSSVIAGSALLSMAAGGDSRMAVDGEPVRRAGRLSDPSVYQSHVNSRSSIAAMDDEACDIQVSPTPSTSSISLHSSHVLRSDPNEHGGLLSGMGMGNGRRAGSVEHMLQSRHRVTLPPLRHVSNYDDMDIEDVDGSSILPPLRKRARRATVAEVQTLAPMQGGNRSIGGSISGVDGFPAELGAEIDALLPSQLVALSSELVRRVANVLPVLAMEAADTALSGQQEADPIDML